MKVNIFALNMEPKKRMRLGQLARKLDVNPMELMQTLANLSIETESGLNTSLSPEQVEAIENQLQQQSDKKERDLYSSLLGKENAEEDQEDEVQELASPTEEDVASSEDEAVEELSSNDQEEEDVSESPTDDDEEVEVIRAPKVSLPGLKVVGKIDLPEPPPKKEPTEEELEAERARQERKERYERNKARRHQKKRKPEKSFEQKRKEEQDKYERKKKRDREKEKEIRRWHYEVNVASKAKPPSIKKEKGKAPQEVTIFAKGEKKEPTSVFGKLWRWLNT